MRYIYMYILKAYSESCRTSKMKTFAKYIYIAIIPYQHTCDNTRSPTCI